MKDLDKTQVYDLRGITEEQAKELLEWLRYYDWEWGEFDYRWFMEDGCLEYSYPEWFTNENKPTTHISTLFEQSYEEQLQEAKKKLEHYKKEVERMENERDPKIGDVCKFWDSIESNFVIGILTDTGRSSLPYQVGDFGWCKNAKKLTEQEVINLLFKKSC